ncbi:oligoendopeptidase F [Pseudobacteriovorax antillogorgiicola]|uniref:Oligopeptidase F n=1 Tax=Pseudobacteriovorax antillogorgiicola TaxID=1513793 RepID=A0A1Y6BBN9_9BACT|nr:oligoendopeptidase F [Pseudobacteriovorax antillogorgiicola]TCS57588.1 oligopeptidase F [Pseudobacteriovorax antillogorgiicola]SME99544.1 oligoendopeptidase F [Pseudobacteriovorax antillogorgiicola]
MIPKFLCSIAIVASASSPAWAETKGPEWDLTELYPSKSAWLKAIDEVKGDAKQVDSCKGTMLANSKNLYSCLSKISGVRKELYRISTWASLQMASDSQNRTHIEQSQLTQSLSRDIQTQFAFVEPELATLPETKLKRFLVENKKLKAFDQYLRNARIQAKHILSQKEEKILSAMQPLAGGSVGVYSMLSNADIEYPTVTLSDGSKVVANAAGYGKVRQSKNRDDRKMVFEAFYSTLKQYERTFGLTLYQSVQNRVTTAKIRNYPNALSAALGSNQLPEEVYRNLVSQVEKNLPTLHRYLKLKKDIMGLKTMEYHDLYPTLLKIDKDYTIDQSRKDLLAAVAPLGGDYQERLKDATGKAWMDLYPRKGKRGGAFMSGVAYDVHPYVFLNHQDDYNSASTYAHEWGHALHSVLSNEKQDFAKARYATFVAETAAIVNEVLLLDHSLKNAKTDGERLFYLDYAMNFLRTTFFRQTQFAEFELKLHDAVEKGEALSGQKISEIYGNILQRYYGHKEGVVHIDPSYHTEWAFVPHFYYGFYVYTYSTSIAAAFNFAEKILAGDKEALDRYLTMLGAGGSKYPHELFIDAGLDMTKPDAYTPMINKANEYMKEMEKILQDKKANS